MLSPGGPSCRHTGGAVKSRVWCCVVLHVVISCYLLLFSPSSVFQLIILTLFELADCSASLFAFRGASLVVLHVSLPEEAASVLCLLVKVSCRKGR